MTGNYNATIDLMISDIKALAVPGAGTVYLNVLGNEPDLAYDAAVTAAGGTWTAGIVGNNGTAAQHKAAWIYIHDRFVAAGVTNVEWTAIYAGITSNNKKAIVAAMYAGDAYVDWIGWDPYNRPTTNGTASVTFSALVSPWYTWATATLSSQKPYLLGEFGTEEIAGNATAKADWFTGMAATIQADTFPLLMMLCYFPHNRSVEGTGISGEFGIDTSTNSRTAWNAAVNTLMNMGTVSAAAGTYDTAVYDTAIYGA